jgi:hypothetical protein
MNMNKLVAESIKDVLKAKPKEQIAREFSDTILALLYKGKCATFYREWGTSSHPFRVSESGWNVTNEFKKYYEEHGDGLYVMFSITVLDINKNPLGHLFPIEKIYLNSVVKYSVPLEELEMAINVLVEDAFVKEKLGGGFHLCYHSKPLIKYFDDVNESIFKPKDDENILEDVTNEILFGSATDAITFGNHRGKPFIDKKGEDSFFKHKFSDNNELMGTYISVEDSVAEEIFDMVTDMSENIKIIGKSTFIIFNETLLSEKKIIRRLCQMVIDEELDFFHIKTFLKDINEDLYQDDENRQKDLNKIFKPKPKEDIAKKLLDQILKEYDYKTAYCKSKSGRWETDPWPKIDFGTGEGFMQYQFNKHKYGIYFHVDDDRAEYAKNKFYELNVAFTAVGKSTFKILSTDKIKMFLSSIIDDTIDDKVDMFMIRKFI